MTPSLWLEGLRAAKLRSCDLLRPGARKALGPTAAQQWRNKGRILGGGGGDAPALEISLSFLPRGGGDAHFLPSLQLHHVPLSVASSRFATMGRRRESQSSANRTHAVFCPRYAHTSRQRRPSR
jgi:hypothetical protein